MKRWKIPLACRCQWRGLHTQDAPARPRNPILAGEIDETLEIDQTSKTISTTAGPLPISPLKDESFVKARQRWKERKLKPDVNKMNKFQRLLARNPYGRIPCPTCPCTLSLTLRQPRPWGLLVAVVRLPVPTCLASSCRASISWDTRRRAVHGGFLMTSRPNRSERPQWSRPLPRLGKSLYRKYLLNLRPRRRSNSEFESQTVARGTSSPAKRCCVGSPPLAMYIRAARNPCCVHHHRPDSLQI